MARDEGVSLAAQILIFPMLDDRNTQPGVHLVDGATWSHEENALCWGALLGTEPGAPDVSPYSAPARLSHFVGMAPAYIEVGALDIFRDECIEYARNLSASGVETELHVYRGALHGYDTIERNTPFARRWRADRIDRITAL
jgi:acetyl esterase/lipase